MTKDVPFSSKRLLLTLTLCACSVILLENHDLADGQSFPLRLAAVGAGLGVCFLFFLPAVWMKKRGGSDVLTLVRRSSPAVRWIAAVVYCLCFLYIALYFLLPYTDMFCKKYYADTSPCLIALLLLACCVYAAFKGANVITRFGIFLFVLAMVTNGLLFGGSLSTLDFRNGSLGFEGSPGGFWQDTVYFITPCFIAALFVCLSDSARQFKTRHVLLALLLTGLKYAAVLFFITFSVCAYAARQAYSAFVLSRVAHFGSFAGIESFYMALSTMSVFMIVSLLLGCMDRAVGKSGSLPVTVFLTVTVFALHWLSEQYSSVKEFFSRPELLIGFSFAAAVVLPVALMLTDIVKKRLKNRLKERSRHA